MARRWRNWGYEAAALDLALRQAGRPAARGARPRSAADHVRQLAGPRRSAERRHDPAARSSGIPACASSSTRRRTGRRRSPTRWSRPGAVHTIDFKGRYGLEVKDDAALVAMYELVLGRLPRGAARGPARPAGDHRARRAARRPGLLRRADPHGGRPRRADAARAHDQRQAVPGRRAARPVRALRGLRGARPGALRRRDGRARRRRAGRSSCSPRCSTPTARTTSRRRATTRSTRPRACPRARWSRGPQRPASGANRPLDPVSIHRYRLRVCAIRFALSASSATCANASRSRLTSPPATCASAMPTASARASCCASTPPRGA